MKIEKLFDMERTIFDIEGEKLLLVGITSTAKDDRNKILITLKFIVYHANFSMNPYQDMGYTLEDLKQFADEDCVFPIAVNTNEKD